MIVAEGCDLTGKSTLAEYIAKEYGFTFKHFGRPEPGQRHWDIARTGMQDPASLQWVCDRMVIGSYIYGPILADQYNFEPVTFEELHAWLVWLDCRKDVLIWATCSNDTIRKRYAERGDVYLSLDQILYFADCYRIVMPKVSKMFPNLLIYNSDNFTPSTWCAEYQGVLRGHAHNVSLRR